MKPYIKFSIATMLLLAVATFDASAQWLITGNNTSSSLGTNSVHPFRIRTNNVERVHFSTSGDVGINTTTPGSRLHLHGNGLNPQLRLSDPAGGWELWGGSDFHIRTTGGTFWMRMFNGANDMVVGPNNELYINNSSGFVGFGTTAPVTRLTVDGTITPGMNCSYSMGTSTRRWEEVWACNGAINTSDARMKENIEEITYGVNAVKRLHPVSYTWKDTPEQGRKLGLLAQEVKTVISEVVKDDGNSMGVFYTDLVPVLVKSIQEQQGTLQAESRVSLELQEQLAAQEKRIAELEAALGLADQFGTKTENAGTK